MNQLKTITTAEFEKQVIQSELPVVVDSGQPKLSRKPCLHKFWICPFYTLYTDRCEIVYTPEVAIDCRNSP
jgi:hypothetical protein